MYSWKNSLSKIHMLNIKHVFLHFRHSKDEDFIQQTNEVVCHDYLGDSGSNM